MCSMYRQLSGLLLVLLLARGLLVLPGSGAHPPDADSLRSEAVEPIAHVRADADEDKVPDRLKDTVTVAGRVTAGRGQLALPQTHIAVVQDSTAGIHVALPQGGPAVQRGDSLRIRGVVEHPNRLTQLQALNYEKVRGPRRVFESLPLTVATAAGERYEGRLARIRGEIVTSGSNTGGRYFVLSDPGGEAPPTITVFIADRVRDKFSLGQLETGDEVEVTGVVGQYNYSYQVEPRTSSDLVPIGSGARSLWIALMVLLGVGVAAAGAVVALRAAVKRRTRELEKSKEQLEEQKQRLRSITENVSEGIYRSTPEGRLVYVNQAFADLFGFDSPDDALRSDPTELYANPEQRAQIIERSNENEGLDGVEVKLQRADGSAFTGLLSGTVARGADGEVKYYDGVVTDITGRKERTEELRRKERRFQAIFADPNILAGLLTPEGTLLEANQTAMEYIDAERDDVLSCSFWKTP